jgi:hypothetical protein
MSICQFYKRGIQHRENTEVNSSQQASYNTTKAPWCSHIYSPVKQAQTRTMGGGNLLKCEGDLEKCALPKDPLSYVQQP